MQNLVLFILFLSIISCGKKNPSSSEESKLGLSNDKYYPQGLSDKLIEIGPLTHAPMNFITQSLTISFDVASQKVTGHSLISFDLKHPGRPYFELKGVLKNVTINQSNVSTTAISDPDGQKQSYWSINETLPSETTHYLEFDYELPTGRVSFVSGGVRFLTDMTDLNGKFFEYWGPVGFEEDAFQLEMKLKIKGASSTHKVFANGSISSSGSSEWDITFPVYYTKSSFYIHLTNQTGLPVQKFVYKGIEKDIPIEVYGVTSALVSSAVAELPKLFKEFEADYGAYPHDKFLAYMNDRSGGMEYVGATITSLGSLDHELLHSWFARSVIPADGRSGWIDEAIASWRDYGYKRATSILNRSPTNLANYSPFRKTTPSNSYVDGRALMAELDKEMAPLGGMKKVLREYFVKYKNQIVTNEEFWYFLEDYSNMNLSQFQIQYVLGGAMAEVKQKTGLSISIPRSENTQHPDPLTEEEVLRLR